MVSIFFVLSFKPNKRGCRASKQPTCIISGIHFSPKVTNLSFFKIVVAGLPPQHTHLAPPPSSYYGGQEHHKYHENGHPHPHHENFSDFVTLVCQETAAQQHHPHPQHQHHLRSPYAGYTPSLPPVSSSAAPVASNAHRPVGRANGELSIRTSLSLRDVI